MREIVIEDAPVQDIFEVHQSRCYGIFWFGHDVGKERTSQDGEMLGEVIPGLVKKDEFSIVDWACRRSIRFAKARTLAFAAECVR